MIIDAAVRLKTILSPETDTCPQEPRPAFLNRKYVVPIEVKKPKRLSRLLLNSMAGSRPASSEKKPTFEYLEQKQLVETPLTIGDESQDFKTRVPFGITKQAKLHLEAMTLNFNKDKLQQQTRQSSNYSNVLFVRKRSVEKHVHQPRAILISNLAEDDRLSPLLPDHSRLSRLPGDSHSEIGSVMITPILAKPEDAAKLHARKLSSRSVRVDLSRSFGGREQTGSVIGETAGLRSAMSSAFSRSVISTRSVQTSGQLNTKQHRTLHSPKSASTKKVTFAKDLVVFSRR